MKKLGKRQCSLFFIYLLMVNISLKAKGLEHTVLINIQKNLEEKYKVKWNFQAKKASIVKNKNESNSIKEMTRGEYRLKQMKARSRAFIKKKKALLGSSFGPESGKKRRLGWMEKRSQQINGWTYSKKQLIKRWDNARAIYQKNIPKIKKALVALPVKEKRIKQKERNFKSFKEAIIIPKGFLKKASYQGTRSTCAAFAAMRALEIKLAQKGLNKIDLSEQYFYWSSKPDCQKKVCSKKGSWVLNGLRRSHSSMSKDLPLESSCPYKSKEKANNETHLPMDLSCSNGAFKVKDFRSVETEEQIDLALRKGHPVIGGFRLDGSFFSNKGNVFNSEGKGPSSRRHSRGHALVIIGKIPYPKKLFRSQGRSCYLVVNSWGEGWGQGGYACLSEKWFRKYRYQIPFIAIRNIE